MTTVLAQLGLDLLVLRGSQLDNRNRILLFSQDKLTSENLLSACDALGTAKKRGRNIFYISVVYNKHQVRSIAIAILSNLCTYQTT